MSRFLLAGVVWAVLLGGFLRSQEGQPQAPAPSATTLERIAALIKQLDAEKAGDREAATDELRKMGEPALAPLEKVLADPPSIEVKFRAQSAIDGIKLDLVRKQALKIDDILAQAKAAQSKDWDSKTLQAQLDRLVEALAAETGKKDLQLPAKPTGAGMAAPPMTPFVQGAFLKDKRLRIAHCQKSVILADTFAVVGHANDCIIIGRQAVCVAHSTNCILIAGQLLDVSHATNSVLLCNSRTGVSHARDSMLAGPEALEISSAYRTTFLNARAPMQFGGVPERMANKSVDLQGIHFGAKAPKCSLEGKLTLTLAIERDEPLALFKLPDGTGEYVARYEQEIKTPQGEPIESLAGWKLIYAGNRLAVFAKGEEIAYVRQGM